MQLKNIVVVNDFDYVQGGASKVAIQTANLLSENKDLNVYFFSGCHDSKSNLSKKVNSVTTNQYECLNDKNRIRGMANGLYNIKAKKELSKLLKKLNPNETIINVHGWTKVLSSSIFSTIYKRKFKIVLTLHDYFSICPNGGFFNYKKNVICRLNPLSLSCIRCNCDSRNYAIKLYRLMRTFIQNKIIRFNKKIKFCIGISEFSNNILSKYLPNARIELIHNPIELDNVQKVNPSKNKYYTFVGRISQEKGIVEFCKTMQNYDNVLIIGDGPLKEELEEKYTNIKFVGWKNNKEIAEYLQQSRILILPSLWYEGSPLVPLEAMNFGIPCIISDKCAGIEYISNNGKIYNTDIADSLYRAIEEIEKNINQYGANAKEYVEKRKEENYCKNIIDYFKKVVE